MAGIAVKDSLRLALCLAGAGLLPGMASAASANAPLRLAGLMRCGDLIGAEPGRRAAVTRRKSKDNR